MNDVNLFFDLYHPDEKRRQVATDTILHEFGNTNFVYFLCETMEKEKENAELTNIISIVLFQLVKKKMIKKVLFSSEQLDYLNIKLFELLFKLNMAARMNILECFKIFFCISSYDYKEHVKYAFETFKKQDDINDTVIALLFIDNWIYYFRTNFNNDKLFLLDLTKEIFPALFSILKLLNNFPVDEINDVFIIYSISSHIFTELDKKVDITYQIHESAQILNMIVSSLLIPIDTNNVSKMKENILTNFKFLLFKYSNSNAIRVDKKEFTESFVLYFLPFFLETIVKCMNLFDDYRINYACLDIINSFSNKNIIIESIYNESFLLNQILPKAFLKEDDIQTFIEIPEQYIEFCLVLKKNIFQNKNFTHRQIISLIIQKIPKSILPNIFNSLVDYQTSSNFIEMEAKIFFLSCIYLYHNIPVDIFDKIYLSLQAQLPPYVIASLLILLSTINTQSLESCMSISIFYLKNSKCSVVQIAAIDLFLEKYDPMTMNIENDINSIIESLLLLATKIHHSLIGKMLEKIITYSGESIFPIINELISNVFNIWENTLIVNEDNYDEKPSSLLLSVSRIFDKLPQNSEVIYSICESTVLFCMNAIKQYQDNSITQLIDICTAISEKLSNPPKIVYDLIPFIFTYIENQECFYNMEIFTDLITSLIRRENFFDFDNTNYIIGLCDFVFENCDLPEPVTNSMLILTCLVQRGGNLFLNLTSKAITMLQEKDIEKNVLVSSIALLSSSLIINEEVAMSYINDNVLSNWTNDRSLKTISKVDFPKFIFWSIYGLLIVSNYTNEDIYLSAIQHLFLFIEYCEKESNSCIKRSFIFPFDSLITKEMIIEKMFSNPKFQNLNEEIQIKIKNYFK